MPAFPNRPWPSVGRTQASMPRSASLEGHPGDMACPCGDNIRGMDRRAHRRHPRCHSRIGVHLCSRPAASPGLPAFLPWHTRCTVGVSRRARAQCRRRRTAWSCGVESDRNRSDPRSCERCPGVGRLVALESWKAPAWAVVIGGSFASMCAQL